MDRPFRDVSIFPSYYKKTAIVAWIVDPAIKDAEFYIYRKYDGGSEWELLNTTPQYGTTYADTTFSIPNKVQTPVYRVVAWVSDKESYDSPEVGVFTKIDRKAFGVAHNIIRGLYYQARQDGIPVLYYPAIKNGQMSSSLDDVTGQRNKASCLSGDTDDPTGNDNSNDYGGYYEGGYYRPFLTYVRLVGARLVRETRLDDGLFDDAVQNAIFLAFPPVRSGDLVVDVVSDRRWLVSDNIKTQTVKSVIPVSYEAVINQQEHNHPCYAVPIPDNYPEMVRRLTWPMV